MRIGIAQINTEPGAFGQTVERMLAQSRKAAEQGAELVVFPAFALAGVELPSFADRPSFMADVAEAIATLTEELPCPALVPVLVDLGEAEPASDVLLIAGDEVSPLRLSARQADENDGAYELPEFDLGGLHFVIALSYEDLDLIDGYDLEDDVIIYLSSEPFAMDDPSSAMAADFEATRFWEDACGATSWLIGVTGVGGYGEQVFCGSSFVASPGGALVASLPSFEEAMQVVKVGGGPETLGEVGVLSREVYDAPFHLWQAISLGIHDFVTKQGATDVALALDGSLSSQVLLALATDALGPLHVHVLVGAAAGSSAPACRDLARRLRVDQQDGPGALAGFDPRDLDELSLATLARSHDAIVLSSLDKTGLALGARQGLVSAASLLPLGDVYRTDVLDMAHVRNTISPIFRRVALGEADSVTLLTRDGKRMVVSGERELTRVDEVLFGFVEYDRPLFELTGGGEAHPDLMDAVLRTLRLHELSRRALAPVLVMSTHTLDEARFPLGLRWQDEHLDGAAVSPGKIPAAWGLSGSRDAETEENMPRPAVTLAPPTPSRTPDLGQIIQMLRDLAEQGGFAPTGVAGLVDSLPDAGEQDDDSDQDGQTGWGRSIFSEN